MAGKLINDFGPLDIKDVIKDKHGELYYPFIKNCDKTDLFTACPFKLYDKIKYTFNGNELNLHTLETNLIDELQKRTNT